jgi:hypothetical protein
MVGEIELVDFKEFAITSPPRQGFLAVPWYLPPCDTIRSRCQFPLEGISARLPCFLARLIHL